jgi:hypothetical protein
MQPLRDRLHLAHGASILRSRGDAPQQIVRRLESGETLTDLIRGSRLAPADVVAALACTALGEDDSLGPALVQERPRRPRLALPLSEPAWSAVFPRAPETTRLALAAGLLLIYDFWDASHEAAQQADDLGEREFSAYWHGIAHRREPDAGNAAYWFRRVGRHPVFTSLAASAVPLLEQHADVGPSGRLISGTGWDPFAMIDLCTAAQPGSAAETLARTLQRLEMWLLLEATFAALESAHGSS